MESTGSWFLSFVLPDWCCFLALPVLPLATRAMTCPEDLLAFHEHEKWLFHTFAQRPWKEKRFIWTRWDTLNWGWIILYHNPGIIQSQGVVTPCQFQNQFCCRWDLSVAYWAVLVVGVSHFASFARSVLICGYTIKKRNHGIQVWWHKCAQLEYCTNVWCNKLCI